MFRAVFSLALVVAGFFSTPQAEKLEQRQLGTFLHDLNRKTGVYAVPIPLLAAENVLVPSMDRMTASNADEVLRSTVAKLQYPARLIRMDLPSGPDWTALELLAFARAQSALFRKPLADAKAGTANVLFQELPMDQARPAIDAVKLRPTYVIALKQANFSGYWQTTYGQMRLEQTGTRVTGNYSTNNGLIRGTVVGTELRFTWEEQDNGTGGGGVLQLSDDGMEFAGPWYNNSNPEMQAGVWTGKRLRKGSE